jgi:RNA polymerase sigma factor (sigma-70 family)
MSHEGPTASFEPEDATELYTQTLDLLARARAGDERSYARLYDRYFARLLRWSSGRLPSHARDLVDTQDIVQEVLVRSLQKVDDFEVRWERAFQFYLRQGVLNAIRDRIRRARPRVEIDPLDERLVDGGPSPLEAAVGADNLRRYEDALARLSPREQEAIVARVEMQCDYHELMEALGCPSPDAARMAVKRAMLHLAEEMNHE